MGETERQRDRETDRETERQRDVEDPIDEFNCLKCINCMGISISDNGSSRQDVDTICKSLLKAYWRQGKKPRFKSLSVSSKIRVLTRAAVPIFVCKCLQWPPQTKASEELDRM